MKLELLIKLIISEKSILIESIETVAYPKFGAADNDLEFKNYVQLLVGVSRE